MHIKLTVLCIKGTGCNDIFSALTIENVCFQNTALIMQSQYSVFASVLNTTVFEVCEDLFLMTDDKKVTRDNKKKVKIMLS